MAAAPESQPLTSLTPPTPIVAKPKKLVTFHSPIVLSNKPIKTIKKKQIKQKKQIKKIYEFPELPSQVLPATDSQVDETEIRTLEKELEAAKQNYNNLYDLFKRTSGDVEKFIQEFTQLKENKKQIKKQLNQKIKELKTKNKSKNQLIEELENELKKALVSNKIQNEIIKEQDEIIKNYSIKNKNKNSNRIIIHLDDDETESGSLMTGEILSASSESDEDEKMVYLDAHKCEHCYSTSFCYCNSPIF